MEIALGGIMKQFVIGRYLLKISPKMRLGARRVAIVSGALLLAQLAIAEPYTVITVSNGGTIQGVVKLAGAAPTIAPIVVTKNQDYCGDSIPNPVYVVGKDGGVQNVEVYLKDVRTAAHAAGDRAHCHFSGEQPPQMFRPRVKVQASVSKSRFPPEDPVLHNTHPQNAVTNATIYNIVLPFKGFSVTKLPAGNSGVDQGQVRCA